MPATKQDRSNLNDLIEAHTERLRLLEVRAARQGQDTPADVLGEIERIERELAQLRQAAAYPVSDELIEELGPTGRYQLWMSHIMRLDGDIGHARREIEHVRDLVEELLTALAKRGIRASKVTRRSKVA